MKINGKGNANFPEDNFQRKKLVKGTAKEEAKHTDANSADALASIGRAFVNMSFKGKSVPSSNIKELSDVEFEEYKKELSEKIKSLPEQIQTKAEKWFQYLNKYSIQVADKILSNEIFYGYNDFLNMARFIIKSTRTKEHAEAKVSIMDKLLTDEELYTNKTVMNCISDTIELTTTTAQAGIVNKILSDNRIFGNEYIFHSALDTIEQINTPEKEKLADKIFSDERIYGNISILNAIKMLKCTKTPEQAKLSDKILSERKLFGNEKFMMNIIDIIAGTESEEASDAKIAIADKILSDERLFNNTNIKDLLGQIILATKDKKNAEAKSNVIDKILSDERLFGNRNIMNFAGDIIHLTNTPEQADARIRIIDKLLSDERLFGNRNIMNFAGDIISRTETPEEATIKIGILNKILSDENLFANNKVMANIGNILVYTQTKEQAEIADRILSDENLFNNKEVMDNTVGIICQTKTEKQAEYVNRILSDKNLYNSIPFMKNASSILLSVNNPEQERLADKILSDENLYNNEIFMKASGNILYTVKTHEQAQITNKIFSDENLFRNENVLKNAKDIIKQIQTPEQSQFADKILSDERLYGNNSIINSTLIISWVKNPEVINELISHLYMVADNKLTIKQISLLLFSNEGLTLNQLIKMNEVIGIDKTSKFNRIETPIFARFIDLYDKKDINEIPIYQKRNFLRNLVSTNSDLFEVTNEVRKHFPLLPKSQEEYCELLPSIIRSLGIETNTLSDSEIKEFNKDIMSIASTLSALTDNGFNDLEIKQEYDKDSFILDTLSVIKDLSDIEKQRVYDYFGFELHKNNQSKTGFSIIGYPVNLDNGNKLSKIRDNNTRQIVEKLRPLVIKFSENNHISCNNKELETDLNKIVSYLPELRPLIGKVQAGNINKDGATIGKGSHAFDIFRHSLKVMQKIVQTPEFNKLNASDKKIMLLASLLHDITKKEGYTDKTHAEYGSFDTFFIAKKFKLSQEEEIKLYNLIKHHEWLGLVNSSDNQSELTNRLQSTAYDLRHDNMLDLALMFTHADLKAVKKDDSFHDKPEGRGRTDFNGNVRSFGESADLYAGKIRELIEQLKPSQPLLPVTKIPKASTIGKAVTTVNSDGSTNIKGVYRDKDGLIIIKYNELQNEDLEKIGFKKGSLVSGIKSTTSAGENVNTGNIKFFAHGLDYPSQLAKFDAFSLVDSDALLSVSYAERPESKYRFFRPQGILLDCDTKYVHGGGNTDSGSGTEKTVTTFKEKYLFGGEREADRTYISDLIKEATGMDDKAYIQFVKYNENKSLSEIEPEEIRIKIIKAFSTINSNIRNGERSYNEMYISNPKPIMAVFAYNMLTDENIDNPINFLNRKTILPKEKNYNDTGGISVYDRTKFLRKYALKHDIPFFLFGN